MRGESERPIGLGEERVPATEAADIETIVGDLRRQFAATLPQGAGAIARRDQHPKAHGCLRATFMVADGLDERLRHGIFAAPGTYDAWVRFSSSSPLMSSDKLRDAHGMAIKLLGVPGEKLLDTEREAETQDFVLANNPAFFVRNARDYISFIPAFTEGRILSFFFGLNPLRCRLHEFFNMLHATKQAVSNPLQIRYWSQTPSRLGPGQAVKYSVIPRLTGPKDPMPPDEAQTPNFLREAMKRTLGADPSGPGVTFSFLVQLQTDPVRMPVEDATVIWDERVAPFYLVAALHIPPQDFDTPARDTFAENLSFMPWHSLPAHQPLGATNRIRRRVYEEISRLRHEHNGVPRREPTPSDPPAGSA